MSAAVATETSSPVASPAGQAPAVAPVKRWSRRVASDTVGLLDLAAVSAGAIVPAYIYSKFGHVSFSWALILQSSLAAAMIVHLMLRTWNMYTTDRMDAFPYSPLRLLGALTVGLVAVLGLGLPLAVKNAHMWVWYAVWLSTSFTLLLTNRWAARAWLAKGHAEGRFDERIAVFGAGPIARRVHDHLAANPHGISFAGVYDDRIGEARINPEGLDVTGKLADLAQAARDGGIDRIIIALPQAADRRIAGIAKSLEQLPVSVHVVTHISSDLVDGEALHRVSNLGPVGMLDVKGKPLDDWSPMIKRVEDVALATILTIVTLPLMALVAIAIAIDSPGPILFRQRRRGLNQQVFEVMKFRTMTVCEDGTDVKQAASNDPRVTRVGRILRRWSMDELPQLFNVLRGEMSLVGPRPHALVHDDEYGAMLEQYASRHQVKPGITGLAQVSGYRGPTPTPELMQARVEKDIEYIKTWSFGLDLSILVRTVRIVIFGDNAH